MTSNINGYTDIEAHILENWPDQISGVFRVEDVLAVDDALTGRQARVVLQRLDGGRDGELGTNKDVIEYTIDAMQREGNL